MVVQSLPPENDAELLSEQKMQQFVSNAVEGMNPRDVTVVITYLPKKSSSPRPGDVKTLPSSGMGMPHAQSAPPPPVFEEELIGLKLDEESKDRLKVYLLIFFLILIVLSCALIVVIIQGSRTRRQLANMHGPAGNYPAIEGQIMDEHPGLSDGQDEDEF